MPVLKETGNIRRKNATEGSDPPASGSTSKPGISKKKLPDDSFQLVDYRHGHLSQMTPGACHGDDYFTDDSDCASVVSDLAVSGEKENWKMCSLSGHNVKQTLEKFEKAIASLNKDQFLNEVCLQAKSVCPDFEDSFTREDITILVVSSEEATDVEGKLMVNAKEAIFIPEQVPAWENKKDFTIRCHGELAQLFAKRLALYDVLIIGGGKKSIQDLHNWTKTNFDLTGDDVTLPVTVLHLSYTGKQIKTGACGQSYACADGQVRATQSGKPRSRKLKTALTPCEVRQTRSQLRQSEPTSTVVVKGQSAKKIGNPCERWIVALLVLIVAFVMFHAVCPIWYPLTSVLSLFGVDLCEYQKNEQ